jgi:hypothetical protein
MMETGPIRMDVLRHVRWSQGTPALAVHLMSVLCYVGMEQSISESSAMTGTKSLVMAALIVW